MLKFDWIKIGVIGKAHGLRGHFFVSDREIPIPIEYESIYIGSTQESAVKTKLQESKLQGNRPLVKCELISSRTDLEKFKGMSIWVEKKNISVDEDEEYLWDDLIGKTVVDCNNIPLGTIKDIYNFGASDIIEISGDEGKTLKISLIEQYFDMNFKSSDPQLKLTEDKEFFEEYWEK